MRRDEITEGLPLYDVHDGIDNITEPMWRAMGYDEYPEDIKLNLDHESDRYFAGYIWAMNEWSTDKIPGRFKDHIWEAGQEDGRGNVS